MTQPKSTDSSDKITITKASVSDMSTLLDWRIEVLREVFSLQEDADTTHLRKENEQYYSKTIPNHGHVAVFAESGSEKIGCGGVCIYQEMPSPDNPTGWCAYLMNIYVRKSFRRKGIGQKIVQFLIDEAKQKGITKIYLETSAAGKALYREMGFVPLNDMMILR